MMATPRGFSVSWHLRSDVLLGLETTRVHVDDARDLRQTDNALVGEVSQMRPTNDREHVVFTERVEGNVTHEHEVVEMADLAERTIKHVLGTDIVAGEKFLIRAHETLGRIKQTFAIRIVADPRDKSTCRSLSLFARWPFGAVDLGHSICARRKRLYDGIHDVSVLPISTRNNGRKSAPFHCCGISRASVKRRTKPSAEGTPVDAGAFRLSLATDSRLGDRTLSTPRRRFAKPALTDI
jgi:hypothetical protein